MGTASLLDAVWRLLANDPTFLNFKGLTPASDNGSKAAYIVKGGKTSGVVDNTTIPIVLLYTRPGKRDHRTSQVYIGKVVIDCFAHDDNTAMQMCDQTQALMQNWEPDAPGGLVARFAHESEFSLNIPGISAHRVFYDISQFVG